MSVMYLLDTNTLSYIARGRSSAGRACMEAIGEDIICISSITEAELRYGLAKRPAPHALRTAVEGLLFKLHILPWGSKEAAAYGELRAQLERAGFSLSAMDMLIAAQAIAAGAVLVTNDNAFSHVDALPAIENWTTDI